MCVVGNERVKANTAINRVSADSETNRKMLLLTVNSLKPSINADSRWKVKVLVLTVLSLLAVSKAVKMTA